MADSLAAVQLPPGVLYRCAERRLPIRQEYRLLRTLSEDVGTHRNLVIKNPIDPRLRSLHLLGLHDPVWILDHVRTPYYVASIRRRGRW